MGDKLLTITEINVNQYISGTFLEINSIAWNLDAKHLYILRNFPDLKFLCCPSSFMTNESIQNDLVKIFSENPIAVLYAGDGTLTPLPSDDVDPRSIYKPSIETDDTTGPYTITSHTRGSHVDPWNIAVQPGCEIVEITHDEATPAPKGWFSWFRNKF